MVLFVKVLYLWGPFWDLIYCLRRIILDDTLYSPFSAPKYTNIPLNSHRKWVESHAGSEKTLITVTKYLITQKVLALYLFQFPLKSIGKTPQSKLLFQTSIIPICLQLCNRDDRRGFIINSTLCHLNIYSKFVWFSNKISHTPFIMYVLVQLKVT